MYQFIMYCKTYSGDFNSCSIMINSFNKYNKDNIVLYLSVPLKEIHLFEKFQSDNIKIISDESYAEKYFATETSYSFSIGYFNQEICKLAFWETELSENYLCIDSDTTFIRDFYISDFMKNEKTPYTVLVQDKDLHTAKWYPHAKYRKEWIKKIWEYIDYDDKRYRTCHGLQILNAKVLNSLKNDFMKPRNLEYKDLIEYSPLEFSWYNAWFQKSKLIEEYTVEPFIKCFHNKADYNFSRIEALSLDALKQEYVGIVLNSNWSKTKGTLTYKKINLFEKIIYILLSSI